jgi:hypothetical protein
VQALEGELEAARGEARRVGAVDAEPLEQLGQARHRADPPEQLGGRHQLAGLDRRLALELRLDGRQVEPPEARAERLRGRAAQQVREHLDLAALLACLELDLAAGHRYDSRQVRNPCHSGLFAGQDSPSYGGRRHGLRGADGEPG